MRNFRPSLLVGALALALAAGSASAQFSGTVIFGDSLSDAGQYGSRFTTNPGLTTAMYVGERYGFASQPSFYGGLDFAQGGARVNSPSPLIPPSAPNLSIAQQVSGFLAKGPLDTNALYQIQGGANDIFVLVEQAGGGLITPAQAQAAVAQAALDLAAQVAKLRAAGAQYIVLQQLPDMGKTPLAAAVGQQATFSALSGLFNTTLNSAVGGAGLQVIQFNTAKFLNEILATPSAFGFVNTTIPVCTTTSSLSCTPATLRDPTGNLTWVFADGVHPTTGAATLLAQAIVSMIQGPEQMAALGEAPLAVERANWRALDGRMWSAIGAPASTGKFQAWAAYDYGNEDIVGTALGGTGDLNTFTVGGDMRVSDNMLVGLAFGYTEYKGDFSSGAGDFKLREPMLTTYVGYGDGPWYVGGTLGFGSLDFDTTRSFALGPVTRSETGSTNGYHTMLRVLGGYWFWPSAEWQHGPFAKVVAEKVIVRQFSESGTDSTGLTFGQQKRDAIVSSLGWQVSGNFAGFRPYARATWEYDFKADERSVSATANGLNGTYSVPGFTPDDNYFTINFGATKDFGKVTGYLTGTSSAGKSDGDFWAVTVGVRIPI